MPWDELFRTGHPEIDRQHQVLFGLIDRVNTGDTSDYAQGIQVVLDLIAYVIQHFAFEEDLMTKHVYPDATAHCAAHQLLRERVGKLRDDLGTGQVDSAALQAFLDDWLRHHIGGEDIRLAQHVRFAGG